MVSRIPARAETGSSNAAVRRSAGRTALRDGSLVIEFDVVSRVSGRCSGSTVAGQRRTRTGFPAPGTHRLEVSHTDSLGAAAAGTARDGYRRAMNLPDQPPTFRPEPEAARPFRWRLETSDGDEVEIVGDLADQRFASQSDAESWVGEYYADLADLGVDAVTLLEADRTVYGPMSLHP